MEDNNVQQPVQQQDGTQQVQPVPQQVQPQEQSPQQQEAPQQVEQPEAQPQEAPAQEAQPVPPAYDPADVDSAEYLRKVQNEPTLQTDDDGYVDPREFRANVMQEMEERLQFERQEQRAWDSLEEQYPELKSDRELRDLIDAQRFADVARGGSGNLSKIAKSVLGKMNAYKQEGKVQAQVSETVQQSASLQTATANQVESTQDSDLMDRMSRGDQAAGEELIKSWLDQGKI